MSEVFDSSTHLAQQQKDHCSLEAATQSKKLDDTAKLRLLGYDAVLGRPLGFWSSTAMSLCYMCPIDEIVVCTMTYAYAAPLVFLIGYPILYILHLTLIGPFAELASAYPVAGGMATWSWRSARAGVRHERKWGWLVSGMVLTGHLARNVAGLYTLVIAVKQLYIAWSGVSYNPITMEATHPEAWWNPVFHVMIVATIAIVLLSRIGRSSIFWVAAGVLAIFVGIFSTTVHAMCAYKNRHLKVNLGFPGRAKWVHTFGYMLFTSLPLRAANIDGAAHMAEETKNPERTVPRAMFISVTIHFILTYVSFACYAFGVAPVAKDMFSLSPMVPTQMILNLNDATLYLFTTTAVITSCTQVLAGVYVTSRFIFALARDFGIPFSTILFKTTKGREPWVVDIVIILSLFASLAGWYVNQSIYFNMISSFLLFFMVVPYSIALALYLLSNLQLGSINRDQFSLGRWSRPCATVALAWLVLSFVQGCFPISTWNAATVPEAAGDLSSLPFLFLGMVAIIIVTWYLYGRAYYMGPIRALTSWTEGSDDKYRTATGRARAIQEYARREKGLPSMSDITVSGSGTGGTTETTSKGSLWKSTLSSAKKFIPWPSAPSAARAQLSGNETGAIPESELLPTTTYAPGARTTDIALQESQLFPDVSRHQPATASHVSEAIPLRKLSGSTGTQHGY